MRLWIPLLAALALGTGVAAADPVPTTMSFVARLAEAGTPVVGAHDFQLDIFDAATNGTNKWSETHDAVIVPPDGVLFLELGTSTPLGIAVFDGGARFLQITIDGVPSSSRIQIGSSPYAVRAGSCANSDTLQSHVATDFQLRIATGCPSGQSIQSVDSSGAVTCETDQDTKFSAGFGLALNGTTFAVDASTIQERVTGTCVAGQYVQAISAAGAVTCGVDANTVFTAGTGLTLTGTQFSVDMTAIQARVTGTCAAGTALATVKADGTVTCEANIENQAASAQAANIFISGGIRTSALVRSGNETGETDPPTTGAADYAGVVHRRMVNKTLATTSVIAHSDLLSLTRGPTAAELNVSFTTNLPSAGTVDCWGVDTSGNPISTSLPLGVGESCGAATLCSQPVFAANQNAVALTCILGGTGHTAEVTMHRAGAQWTGYVTSDVNQ